MDPNQLAKVVEACQRLDLAKAKLPDEYSYSSPCLAIVDAIYSIGVTYQSTMAVVDRLAKVMGLEKTIDKWPGARRTQVGISHLLALYETKSAQEMANDVYKNRQRTSATNGILKAEAVRTMAEKLGALGIEYFQDIPLVEASLLEETWKGVQGQKSGISLRYFRMLVGVTKEVKPDRMVLRFLERATGKVYTPDMAAEMLIEAAQALKKDYPTITARLLDYMVWQHARTIGATV